MRKIMFLTLAAMFALAAQGAPPQPGSQPAPPQRGEQQRERKLGPWVWRAFSRLSEEERQTLLKLQETDPEAYRKKRQELGEQLRAEEEKERKALLADIEKFRAATDEKEQTELKKKITEAVTRNFMERLEDNKRQLEETKRRAVQLEEELGKRESNAKEIIHAIVDSMIKGTPPPHPPARP